LWALAGCGAWLLWQGATALFTSIDCSGLSTQECALEEAIVHGFGKRQLAVGGALGLLALGLRKLWKRS